MITPEKLIERTDFVVSPCEYDIYSLAILMAELNANKNYNLCFDIGLPVFRLYQRKKTLPLFKNTKYLILFLKEFSACCTDHIIQEDILSLLR